MSTSPIFHVGKQNTKREDKHKKRGYMLRMKRTMDSFVAEKNAAVPGAPVPEVEMPIAGPTSATCVVPVVTPAPAPNPDLPSNVKMASSDSEPDQHPEPTKT